MAVNHMKQNSTLSVYAEPMHYDLKELLVALRFLRSSGFGAEIRGDVVQTVGIVHTSHWSAEPSRLRRRCRGRASSRWKCLSGIFNLVCKKYKRASAQKGYGQIRSAGSATSQTRLREPYSNTPPTFFSWALMVMAQLTAHVSVRQQSIYCGQSVARYSLWDQTPSSATARRLL